MNKFIKNLSWMSLGTTVSMIFLFIISILAGRWLGPTEYGKYNIITSLGQLFIIPMFLGLTTPTINYLAKSKTFKNKKKLISTSFYFTVIFTIVSSIIFLSLQPILLKSLKINQTVFYLTLIYSIFLSIKYVAESIFKGKHLFKIISFSDIINSLVIFLMFLLLATLIQPSSHSYIISIVSGLIIYIFIFLITQKPNPQNISLKIFRKLLKYSVWSIIGCIIGFILNNLNKIILNNHIGTTSVGLFSAYSNAASALSLQAVAIFVNVFFPTVSQIQDTTIIQKKINKLFKIFFIPLVSINFIITSMIILILGKQYGFNPIFIILLSISWVLFAYYNVLMWLINSRGIQGVKSVTYIMLIPSFLSILVNFFSIKYFQLYGAIIASIAINAGFLILFNRWLSKKNQ